MAMPPRLAPRSRLQFARGFRCASWPFGLRKAARTGSKAASNLAHSSLYRPCFVILEWNLETWPVTPGVALNRLTFATRHTLTLAKQNKHNTFDNGKTITLWQVKHSSSPKLDFIVRTMYNSRYGKATSENRK